MAKRTKEIGYVCRRDHYCFYADPEEFGACGSKRVGGIYIELDDGIEWNDETQEIIEYANRHLAHVIETWRGE